MKIGVISEGHADRAVIANILIGLTEIEENDILSLRPIYNYDETDKANRDPLTFSSWSLVKQECEKRELIDGFFLLEGNDFVVIHIDTAEAELYGVTRPDRNAPDYCVNLRQIVVQQINDWLNNAYVDEILYAVAIEEIDAWILPIYEKRDSATTLNAKERLIRILSKKGTNSTSNYDNYKIISKSLSKTKEINRGKLLSYNCSLEAFYEEIQIKVIPKLDNNS